jgi:glycerol-3-phosphate cytidylyltransferase-like family protein
MVQVIFLASSTIDEDVRVEVNSNNHRNNTSFSLKLESVGLVDNGDDSRWDDMFKLLSEFKQKHGHFKITCDCGNKNGKLGRWMINRRRDYREYKRTNGKKGNLERMKRLERIGLVDDITTGYEKVGLKENWYDMYSQLFEFKQKHGHVKVPQESSENKKLGNWVKEQRSNYRKYKRMNGQKGNLERMKCLESIGLVDDITTGDANEGFKGIWYGMYNQLLEFKQKYGHVKVPTQYNENKKFGNWVKEQRSNYRKYKRMNGQKGDPERMKCLESIGLVDDITTGYANGGVNKNWHDMYNQLLEFKQKHGHVKVPQQYNENKKLGIWVSKQRSNYRKYKRTNGQTGDPERMKCLESIGLVDNIIATEDGKGGRKENWYDMCNQLLEFKQKHRHFKIPSDCGNENKKLVRWMYNWRRNYRVYKRTNGEKGDPERMKRLESIGLVDDIATGYEREDAKENWYDMYNQLLEFKQKHGHVKVPQRHSENPKLGNWVKHWRRKYREYKRTNGQKGDPVLMKHLESIGLVDDITTGYKNRRVNTSWDDMYNQLLEFKQKHGHVKVPQQYNENPKLGRWVRYWRNAYREYKRTNGQKREPEWMKHLESIGLVDDIRIRIHHDEMKKCANVKASTPIIVSSMSPTSSSYTQTITKEIPLLAGMKGDEKNGDHSDGVNHTQANLDFLGSELRGKGGFWV